MSYQMNGTRCELVDENKLTAPGHFKPLPGYKYYELTQRFKKVFVLYLNQVQRKGLGNLVILHVGGAFRQMANK